MLLPLRGVYGVSLDGRVDETPMWMHGNILCGETVTGSTGKAGHIDAARLSDGHVLSVCGNQPLGAGLVKWKPGTTPPLDAMGVCSRWSDY